MFVGAVLCLVVNAIVEQKVGRWRSSSISILESDDEAVSRTVIRSKGKSLSGGRVPRWKGYK